MKRYSIIIIIAISSAFICGCEKTFLTANNPDAPVTTLFWRNSSDAQMGLNAVYGALQFPYVMSGDGMVFRESITDLAYIKNNGASPKLAVSTFNWINTMTEFESMWSQLYIGIFRANQVLSNVPNINMPQSTKDQILGQAHFLRGLYYFWLASNYNDGQIPLITKIPDGPNQIYNKYAARADVYALIAKDLDSARLVLPKSWSNAEAGKATWGAATTLIGQIALYEGDFTKAASYLKEVIDCPNCSTTGTPYALTTNIKDNFNVAGEFNNESIFEVSFSEAVKTNLPAGGLNNTDGLTGSEATNRARFLAPTGAPNGTTNCEPSNLLNDIVRTDTMDFSKAQNFTSGLPNKLSARTMATLAYRDDNLLFYGTTTSSTSVTWSQNRYRVAFKKFTNYDTKTSEDVTYSRSGINERVFRLADVYLMYAEAIVRKDKVASIEAIEYLNKVRRRSYLMEKNTVDFTLDAQGGKAFLNYLMFYERPRELCGEGFGIRWGDLRRWSRYDNVDYLKQQIIKRATTPGAVYDPGTTGSATAVPLNPAGAGSYLRSVIDSYTFMINNPAPKFLPIPAQELNSNLALNN